MQIIIDPGHGGSDPGAVGLAGTREAEVNLSVSLKLKTILEQASFTVLMTREGDYDVGGRLATAVEELQARCHIANQAGADLFVSIHCNAAESRSARGVETWYYQMGEFAAAVQSCLSCLGLVNRGIKQGNFYVLKHTRMPAVLVELGFLSNPDEELLLGGKEFQRQAAEAIAAGIRAYQNTWSEN